MDWNRTSKNISPNNESHGKAYGHNTSFKTLDENMDNNTDIRTTGSFHSMLAPSTNNLETSFTWPSFAAFSNWKQDMIANTSK